MDVVVGKVVDLLFTEVVRQICYVFRYKENIAMLNQKTEDLKGVRERIQGRINEAVRKGEDIEGDVQTWINSVDNITSDAETFLAKEVVAAKKIACFCSLYRSSREAAEKTSSVIKFHDEGNKFVTVSRAAPSPGIDAHSSKNIDAYESQKSAMQDVMDALKEEKIRVVGVCGVGGVGKTTLVTELGKRVKASKQFDEVVMAVVSQPINIRNIQDNIASMLGMGVLPDNGESRRGKLWDRIRRGNKVLVILDDLWSGLDLDELGVPIDQPNCKIVLTSRSKDVCDHMDAQKVISVDPMPEEEAWSLFKQVVGERVETDRDINPIAEVVARECKGLPIAILAVGRALRNKTKGQWEDAYHQIKQVASPSINPMLREVFPKLELSYKCLGSEEAKSLFLLCSMFPEDHEIPVESLAQYGMGLKLFQDRGCSLQDARRGARNTVNILKDSFLLFGGKDNYHVKMHDVVRDVAIIIASKGDEKHKFLVTVGSEWPDVDPLKKYTGISHMKNNVSELPVGLECPELQILLLQDNRSLETIPNEYFQRMENLKVLDLRECRISSFPLSLSLLTTLRSLHLDGSKVKDISSLEVLKKLEILTVSWTDIDQVPEQIGCLKNLRLLNISHCSKMSHIAPGVISNLCKLEDLRIEGFTNWDIEKEGNGTKNASLMELNSLPNLTSLEIEMPDSESLPLNPPFKSLQRFTILIGNTLLPRWPLDEGNCTLSLALDIMQLPGWIKELMKAVEYLSLWSCRNLNSIIRDLNQVHFNKVRCLEVSNCNDVSCLADMGDCHSTTVFCNLETLCLAESQNLTQICRGQLLPSSGSFSKLSSIEINRCNGISSALEFNLLSCLQNLRRLKVWNCSSVKCIVGGGDERWKEREIEELEDETGIHSSRSRASLLPNLEEVTLNRCGNLRYVFSPCIAKHLSQLCLLMVWNCEKMEAIIGGGGTEAIIGTGKKIMFPSLLYIDLKSLPRVESFSSEHHNIVEYPSLSTLVVKECPNMESWGHGIQVTPNLKENGLDCDESVKIALREGDYGTELTISKAGTEVHPKEEK